MLLVKPTTCFLISGICFVFALLVGITIWIYDHSHPIDSTMKTLCLIGVFFAASFIFFHYTGMIVEYDELSRKKCPSSKDIKRKNDLGCNILWYTLIVFLLILTILAVVIGDVYTDSNQIIMWHHIH